MTERSLTFKILTTAETAALEATTDALADLARAAGDTTPDLDDAARGLQDVSDSADNARTQLRDVEQAARQVDLDQLGDEARDAARDVDRGFDAIGRSADAGARKVKTETGEMRRSLKGVGDEAGSTAREAAASFGSSGDIGDALQEVAANAPATLGPLGLAFGAAAAIGVGLFRARTEALKTRVDELVDAMIDAGGRLSKEFVNAQVLQLVKDGEAARLEELVDRYQLVGVTVRDVIRARAGDEEAIEKVNAALDAEAGRRKQNVDDLTRSEAAVAALRDGIGEGAEALRLATEATDTYNEATGAAGDTLDQAKESAARLRESLRDPIEANVTVNAPSQAQLDAIRRGIVRGIGPIRLDAPRIATPGSALFYNTRTTP